MHVFTIRSTVFYHINMCISLTVYVTVQSYHFVYMCTTFKVHVFTTAVQLFNIILYTTFKVHVYTIHCIGVHYSQSMYIIAVQLINIITCTLCTDLSVPRYKCSPIHFVYSIIYLSDIIIM